MTLIQGNITSISIGIIGVLLFMYVLYQILLFMNVSTIYVFEYLMFYLSLLILYVLLPKDGIVWQ